MPNKDALLMRALAVADVVIAWHHPLAATVPGYDVALISSK